MIFLLSVIVKVSVILAITLLLVTLLRQQSAALRHWVLALGVFCAAVTPGLSLLMPQWNINVIVDDQPTMVPSTQFQAEDTFVSRFTPMPIPVKPLDVSTDSSPSRIASADHTDGNATTPSPAAALFAMPVRDRFLLLWAVGCVVCLAAVVTGLLRLAWIAVVSRPLRSDVWEQQALDIARAYGLKRPPAILQCRNLTELFTWGWRTPRILVPEASETWPAKRVQAVLCHELAHASRGDWIIQVTAQIVRALYWFNPLVWIACRSMRRESEQACDDAALRFGIAGLDYASHLLDVVRSMRRPARRWSYALPMAGSSNLQRRFAAMLNPTLNRRALSNSSITFTAVAFLALAIPLSVMRAASVRMEPAPPISISAGIPELPAAFFTQAPTNATLEGAGSVEGTVRRIGTGEPVAGVQVALQGGPADAKAVEDFVSGVANRGIVFRPKRIGTVDEVLQDALDAAGAIGVGPGFPLFQEAVDKFIATSSARYVAMSGSDGRFTVRNVPAGQYRVRTEREGFFEPVSAVPIKINVESNRSIETIVTLSAGGVVTGRILDAIGRPVQDASVDALALTYENGFPVLRSSVSKTTDDQGEYRLFWLVPGDYYIMATVPQKPGAPVTYLRTLYPGNPDVSGAAPVSIRAGDVLSGLDIKLRSDRLPKLSGRLTTTIPAEETAQQANVLNQALGRPSLLLVSRDANKPDITGGGARVAGTVVLNGGAGDFQTTGVPSGSYDLYARIPESNAGGGAGFAFSRIPVEVGTDDISGLAIAVHHSVNVRGTVTVDGKPPQRTTVRVALRSDGSSIKLGIYQTLSQRYVNANPDGSFTVIQVPPGLYRVDVGSGLPEGLYIADVRYGARSVFDSGFQVGSETPDPVQVLISSGAGIVEGTVQDGGGKSLAGVTVLLAPHENRRQNPVLFHTATTDAAGRFVIHNVAPGSYKLFSWQQTVPAYAWYNAGFMSRYEDRGRVVSVTQGSSVSQQVVAIP